MLLLGIHNARVSVQLLPALAVGGHEIVHSTIDDAVIHAHEHTGSFLNTNNNTSRMSSWVDRMRMEPRTGGPPASGTAATSERATTSSGKDDNNDDRDDPVAVAAQQPLEFNIATLNLLAESYLTPRSHPGLPREYAEVALDPPRRRRLLLETLERFCGPRPPPAAAAEPHDGDDDDDATRKWDVLALQELDLVEDGDPILPAFESWGYRVVRTPSDQRRDCCAIAYDASKFALRRSEVVRFDDLATLQRAHVAEDGGSGAAKNRREDDGGGGGDADARAAGEEAAKADDGTAVTYRNVKPGRSNNTPPELTGMVRSFLRRNCAVVAHLESVRTGQSIVVASVHLYWHPGYEYVKLCQAKYLLDFVAAFAIAEQRRAAAETTAVTTTTAAATATQQVPSVIICGDINSKPGSAVHKLFVEPHVDARTVAPWRYFWDQDNEEMYTEEDDNRSTAKEEEGGGQRDEVTAEDCSDINNGNESSENAASQHDHNHHLVGEDPTVTANFSNFPTATDDPEKERASGNDVLIESTGISFPASGFMMSGLPADFTASCGIIDSNFEDKNDTIESETPEPNKTKVEPTEANVDTSYDDIESNQYKSQLLDTAEVETSILETRIPDIDPAESNDHINGDDDDSKASLAMRRLMKHNTPQDYQHSTPPLPVKYMLDYTLNRFTR
jgi:endonuclease/exonuclease/phosphatase family metal-dependent hydrolase